MKRRAQPPLLTEGQQTLEYYAYALQQVEGLSIVNIRNYLSDLHQFNACCESFWREIPEQCSFTHTPQAVALPLLIRSEMIHTDPTSVLKEASMPRQLSDKEVAALVVAINATRKLRDNRLIIQLLQTGLRARELCTLTRRQVYLGKRNGVLHISKRRKVRDVQRHNYRKSLLYIRLQENNKR